MTGSFEAYSVNKKLTDEQADQLLKRLVDDASFDDAAVEEIANSPQLWWGVQRTIKADERSASVAGAVSHKRWLLFAAPLGVAVLSMIFFSLRAVEKPAQRVSMTPTQMSTETGSIGSEDRSAGNRSAETPPVRSITAARTSADLVRRSVADKERLGPRQPQNRPRQLQSRTNAAKPESAEVKSEFIALSYARNPDSGQIVRVKVPSSMMVSLGLVASVERPNSLINAEILVGDDGMTHAIRFIR